MPELYRPSNGSEGLVFQHRFCNRCIHDKGVRADPPRYEEGCAIWARALMYSVDEPYYPVELVREEPVGGRCTAFEQDPDEPVFGPDTPRTFPLPSEIAGAIAMEDAVEARKMAEVRFYGELCP